MASGLTTRWRVDGEPANTLALDDRGLAYGDGVFRTLRVSAGQPAAWATHLQRLAHDCARLDLAMPDVQALANDIAGLFGPGADGVAKIIVTRGSGGRGYAPSGVGCRRIVSAQPLPKHAIGKPAPLTLAWSPIVLASQPALAGVKHLNRLEQVLAQAECARRGALDALMCDEHGHMICTTMRNILFRDASGDWLCPSHTRAGVMGATRARLLQALAARGDTVHEMDIPASMLTTMSAAIACNSVGGTAAITAIGARSLSASDAMADDCRRLLETYGVARS